MDVLFELLVLAAAPLMLIGFAPPRMLRMLWRRREEAELREAGHSLMEATTMHEVARILLPHARTLLGAHAAMLEDEHGAIVASVDANGNSLAAVDQASDRRRDEEPEGSVTAVPLRKGRLIVHTSPLTPFFGDEELSELQELAGLADLAIARNELLDSQRTLAAIVESSDDAIISKTLDGTITSWNRGAEQIYGYRADEAIGRSISIPVPPGHDDLPEIMEKIRRGESTDHYETKRLTKDGRLIDASLTISPINDAEGAVTGASVIARDVSDRRLLDEERAAAHEEADRANRAKSEFLSRMSHELRTPLNAVLGFAQLLELETARREQREAVDADPQGAAATCSSLINEVLDIARIEAGELALVARAGARRRRRQRVHSTRAAAGAPAARRSRDGRPADGRATLRVRRPPAAASRCCSTCSPTPSSTTAPGGTVRVSLRRTATATGADRGHRHRARASRRADRASCSRRSSASAPSRPTSRAPASGSRSRSGSSRPWAARSTSTSEPGEGSTFWVELAVGRGARSTPERLDADAAADHGSDAGRARRVLYIEDNLANLKLVETDPASAGPASR